MSQIEVRTINVQELKNRLEQSQDLCLIDVREQYEWDALRIPGAYHIPKAELTARIGEKTIDHAKPIYLHCKGGVRSLDAAKCLLQMGYQEVYSIDGGICEWELSGYPVIR